MCCAEREQPILNRYTYQVHLPRNRRNKTCRNPGKFEFLSLLETTHRGRYRGLPLGSFDCSLKYFKRPFHAQGLNIQKMQSTPQWYIQWEDIVYLLTNIFCVGLWAVLLCNCKQETSTVLIEIWSNKYYSWNSILLA